MGKLSKGLKGARAWTKRFYKVKVSVGASNTRKKGEVYLGCCKSTTTKPDGRENRANGEPHSSNCSGSGELSLCYLAKSLGFETGELSASSLHNIVVHWQKFIFVCIALSSSQAPLAHITAALLEHVQPQHHHTSHPSNAASAPHSSSILGRVQQPVSRCRDRYVLCSHHR